MARPVEVGVACGSSAAEGLVGGAGLEFKAANVSLINAYAAAVGGGQPTIHDKVAAENMLNTAMSPEAYTAVVNQLITEMDAALAAPRNVMDQMRLHDTGGAGAAHSTPQSDDEALLLKWGQ
jgi:hypothetical protein